MSKLIQKITLIISFATVCLSCKCFVQLNKSGSNLGLSELECIADIDLKFGEKIDSNDFEVLTLIRTKYDFWNYSVNLNEKDIVTTENGKRVYLMTDTVVSLGEDCTLNGIRVRFFWMEDLNDSYKDYHLIISAVSQYFPCIYKFDIPTRYTPSFKKSIRIGNLVYELTYSPDNRDVNSVTYSVLHKKLKNHIHID